MKIGFRPLSIKDDWAWAQQCVPLNFPLDVKGIVTVDMNTGDRLAVVVFDSWTENSVTAHYAILNPFVIRSGFFEEAMRYVFVTANRKKMIGLIRSDNEDSLRVTKKIGFEEVVVVPDYFEDNVDLHVLMLKREDCRFIAEHERAA